MKASATAPLKPGCPVALVAAAWFLGMIVGLVPFFGSMSPELAIARYCLTKPSGFWGVMLSAVLPVLITAVFFCLAGLIGVAVSAFLEGFLYAFVSACFLICLGGEGILLCGIVLVFHQLCIPLYCFLWIYLLHCSRQSVFPLFLFTFLLCFAAGLLNYALVMPFLASLIDI